MKHPLTTAATTIETVAAAAETTTTTVMMVAATTTLWLEKAAMPTATGPPESHPVNSPQATTMTSNLELTKKNNISGANTQVRKYVSWTVPKQL